MIFNGIWALIDGKEFKYINLEVNNGIITHIEKVGYGSTIDSEQMALSEGDLIMLPGLIDVHNDSIEKIFLPRKSFKLANIDIKRALDIFFGQTYSAGITSVCASLISSTIPGIRNFDFFKQVLEQISQYASEHELKKNLMVNCRYEIASDNFEEVLSCIKKYHIDILTLNDHIHGGISGWKCLKAYRNIQYYGKMTYIDYLRMFWNVYRTRKKFWKSFSVFRDSLQQQNTWCGIHDIGDKDKQRACHFDYLEFPRSNNVINECDKPIVMGAPNYLYGSSQANGIEVKCYQRREDLILCSDYILDSMLKVIRGMDVLSESENINLINCMSRNPAQLLGVEKGVISKGYDADFIILRKTNDGYDLKKTFVAGKCVYNDWK